MQAINSIRIVEMSGRAWNFPMPMVIRTALFLGTALLALQVRPTLQADPRGGRHAPMSIELITIADGRLAAAAAAASACRSPLRSASSRSSSPTRFFGCNALQLIASRIYGFVNVYVLLVGADVPADGGDLDRSGVARDLYDAMSIWAGGLPGGVAVMTLDRRGRSWPRRPASSAARSSCSAWSHCPRCCASATTGTSRSASICAGGSLGTMIPPSIVLSSTA